MHVHFDPDFDTGAAIGLESEAAFGRAVVGPKGFLELLEMQLGLTGVHTSHLHRLTKLLANLKQEGFWTRSFDVDPFGTAEKLLRWRDDLVGSGWQGNASAGRLGPLWSVTSGLPLGLEDRISRVGQRLKSQSAQISSLTLYVQPSALPPVWRGVTGALEAQGVAVEVAGSLTPKASASTNLRAVQDAFLTGSTVSINAGCSSLQLVRPGGPVEAADDLAAFLAELEETATLLNADGVLDEALARHGVPTTGRVAMGGQAPVPHAPLSVLPLALELAFGPRNPQHAVELLNLADSPLPGALRGRMLFALDRVPSTKHERWQRAIASGLDRASSDSERQSWADCVELLFAEPQNSSGQADVEHLLPRIALVKTWAETHSRRRHPRSAAMGAEVVAQCNAVGTALSALAELGEDTVTRARMRQLVSLATPRAEVKSADEQLGSIAIGRPGGLHAPSSLVVWWNFTRDSRPSLAAQTLTKEERGSLATAGVELFDTVAKARSLSERERRPLLWTARNLILVSPLSGVDGEPSHPHPLWDEIAARIDDTGDDVAVLSRRKPTWPTQPASVTRELREPARAFRTYEVAPGAVKRRSQESPSSLEKLIGCELAHAFQYGAGVGSRSLLALEVDGRALGNAAHDLLAELALSGAFSRDASAEAEDLFDKRIESLVEQLALPSRHSERTELRTAVSAAAGLISELVRNEGFRVESAEAEVADTVDGLRVAGRPDLVLRASDGSLLIVDFKLGGAGYRRKELREGACLQVAAYATVLKKGLAQPTHVAFHVLKTERLLVGTDGLSTKAEYVSGPDVAEVWAATQTSAHERLQSVAGGVLTARGVPLFVEDPEADAAVVTKSTIMDGALEKEPPCRFCDYQALCGRQFLPREVL